MVCQHINNYQQSGQIYKNSEVFQYKNAVQNYEILDSMHLKIQYWYKVFFFFFVFRKFYNYFHNLNKLIQWSICFFVSKNFKSELNSHSLKNSQKQFKFFSTHLRLRDSSVTYWMKNTSLRNNFYFHILQNEYSIGKFRSF